MQTAWSAGQIVARGQVYGRGIGAGVPSANTGYSGGRRSVHKGLREFYANTKGCRYVTLVTEFEHNRVLYVATPLASDWSDLGSGSLICPAP